MKRSSATWALGLKSSRSDAVASLEHPPLPDQMAPWLVEYELDVERGQWLKKQLGERPWTLWRYRELLPLQSWQSRVDLGEGGTPLVDLARLFPGCERIWAKQEAGNPTGSFKARGLALAVSRARELGAPGVELPSAGNAAIAAAAYAAAAGIPCRLALPVDTPRGVIARCQAFGSEVLVGGDTLVESRRLLARESGEFWDLSTFREPYRVEGKKTMGFELVEQLGWRLPDWIVYPTGGGTGIVAMAKAFAELRSLGLIAGESCRFVVVQMEGCAPIVEAYAAGSDSATAWSDARTAVWGLRVPSTIADFLILRAVRESGGTAITISESAVELMESKAALEAGLEVGPEGAAALLAVDKLIREGRMEPEQEIVVFQTGHPANYR
jgi:threonine synthase